MASEVREWATDSPGAKQIPPRARRADRAGSWPDRRSRERHLWAPNRSRAAPFDWNTPIWEHDLAKGLRILCLAIDTHLITSHFLLPLLIRQRGGQLVEVTDGTVEYNAAHYPRDAALQTGMSEGMEQGYRRLDEYLPSMQ